MADKPRHSSKILDRMQTLVPSEIRNLVQTLAFVALSGAGIWEFVLKEIIWPNAAPINLTTEVTLKEVGFSNAGGGESTGPFEAIEVAVTAKNPSTLDVYLLGNCWYAKGFKFRMREENKDWVTAINNPMRPDALGGRISRHVLGHGGAYYDVQKTRVVAGNAVFTDYVLHPNESISASFVIFVPQNRYDVLQVFVQLPTTAVADEAAVAWTVVDTDTEPDTGCLPQYSRKPNGYLEKLTSFFRNRNNTFEKIEEDALNSDSRLKYQIAKSRRELSLWQSKPLPTDITTPPGTSPSPR